MQRRFSGELPRLIIVPAPEGDDHLLTLHVERQVIEVEEPVVHLGAHLAQRLLIASLQPQH